MTGAGRKLRRRSLLRDDGNATQGSHTWNDSMTIRLRACSFCSRQLVVGETPTTVILSRSAEKHLKENHGWPVDRR